MNENRGRSIHLTNVIKNKALELGFDKVGIAPARKFDEEAIRLQEWIDLGYHATMQWMSDRAEERKDIHKYFPGARSVVSVAMNYFHRIPKGELKVSSYAWGSDYHDILKKRLRLLLSAIQQIRPEINGVVCVDTSPVMEKVWAQRAGLGWIGKHTNLISRDYGSWIFLGELILGCELDYDTPFSHDLCGSCTACIDSCPTGAIANEHVLDANRCISYLTIEHQGALPEEFSHQLHGWIYGCDICQEVCPWCVKFSQPSRKPAFKPRREIVERSVKEWKALTEEQYNRILRKSALRRTKYSELKRNIVANMC